MQHLPAAGLGVDVDPVAKNRRVLHALDAVTGGVEGASSDSGSSAG
ncbi:hypothetical protein [Nocardiopsis sp. LDBS0036]